MEPVHDIMPAALASVLRRAPPSEERVTLAWRAAVGPGLAKVTSVELRDGVLHVTTRDVSWQREIERSAVLIRSRLTTLLGEKAVRRLSITSS